MTNLTSKIAEIIDRSYTDRTGHSIHDREWLADVANEIASEVRDIVRDEATAKPASS